MTSPHKGGSENGSRVGGQGDDPSATDTPSTDTDAPPAVLLLLSRVTCAVETKHIAHTREN